MASAATPPAKRRDPDAQSVFVGVDVGTGSARAAAFDLSGRLLGEAAREIKQRTPCLEHFEQSSEDIWQSCCAAVRGALTACGRSDVAGLAFDATCSLVVLGKEDAPLAVGADMPDPAARSAASGPDGATDGKAEVFNVIMWCDHRAVAEAEIINATGHRLLRNVGGAVSPEMEMPKLAWLKRHRPGTYAAARRFFDLADYLTYRAAGGFASHGDGAGLRSMCTVVCKWNFDAEAMSWNTEFLDAVGLSDLSERRVGAAADIREVGSRVPGGVCEAAARDLGISAGAPLGVGIIDAHAGGLGCLGGEPPPGAGLSAPLPLAARMALIAGTSTCHMASSEVPVFVPGVWGPYASAMVPGLFLNEGGQSAAGAALDFFVEAHAAYPALRSLAAEQGRRPTELLNERVDKLASERGLRHRALLTVGLFVGPDLNGCRSPLADPHLRGSVVGLGLQGAESTANLDGLALLYLAAVQALAYSTRAIVDAVNRARAACPVVTHGLPSPPLRALCACGGLAGNELYVQAHADALGMPVLLPEAPGAMMPLGGAMLAAAAAGCYRSVGEAMRGMGALNSVVLPTEDPAVMRYHDARYEIFLRMQRHQQEYRTLEQAALLAS